MKVVGVGGVLYKVPGRRVSEAEFQPYSVHHKIYAGLGFHSPEEGASFLTISPHRGHL